MSQITNEGFVLGCSAIGAGLALITGSWIPLAIAGVAAAVAWIVGKWDWLCENVIGEIPKIDALVEEARAAVKYSGVGKARTGL